MILLYFQKLTIKILNNRRFVKYKIEIVIKSEIIAFIKNNLGQ